MATIVTMVAINCHTCASGSKNGYNSDNGYNGMSYMHLGLKMVTMACHACAFSSMNGYNGLSCMCLQL
eukprot:673498-Pelagomonas_calceolata.AAC.1